MKCFEAPLLQQPQAIISIILLLFVYCILFLALFLDYCGIFWRARSLVLRFTYSEVKNFEKYIRRRKKKGMRTRNSVNIQVLTSDILGEVFVKDFYQIFDPHMAENLD